MSKPEIALVGYYGYGNYGDELFKSIFERRLPEFSFLNPQDSLGRPFYTRPLAEKIARVQAVLIGGGDLVIPTYWTDQYFEPQFLAKPVILHGVGVPTWGGENAEVVQRLGEFFQNPSVRSIHVRDEESRVWINDNLHPVARVTTGPDIVCAMDLPPVSRQGQPIFGLITRKQMPGEIHWDNVRALCDRAVALGYRLRQIILGTGEIGEEDRQGAQEFSYPGMECFSSEDIDQITQAIGECSAVASMKFHGCVVAIMYGIPAIALITTDKFRNFYRIIHRGELVGHHTHKDLADRLTAEMAPIDPEMIESLRRSAVTNLSHLGSELISVCDNVSNLRNDSV